MKKQKQERKANKKESKGKNIYILKKVEKATSKERREREKGRDKIQRQRFSKTHDFKTSLSIIDFVKVAKGFSLAILNQSL